MKNLFQGVLLVSLVALGGASFAQSFSNRMPTVNDNSLRPIHESDQMWKKTVWRRIDFKEKQNKGFFAKDNEFTKYIIEGIKSGAVKPYENDSLVTRISLEEFTKRIQVEDEGGGGDDFGDFGGFDDFGGGKKEEAAPAAPPEYMPKQLTFIELMEDVIFDKQRSRMFFDIQAITLYLPSELSLTKTEKKICAISYKELVENYLSKDPNAIWYNTQNNAEHRTLVDALELKLYAAKLVKVSNPENMFIDEIYNESEKQGLMATYWMQNQLMEYEHNMWEY